MNKMDGSHAKLRRFGIIIVFAVALAVVSTVIYLSTFSKNREVIKIGMVIPLSGPASQHTVVADAIRLAVDEVNMSGGVNGSKLQLIIKDSKYWTIF